MSNRLFAEEPYRTEFQAVVLSCIPVKEGYEIRLDKTAFYPEGGGQPGDRGWLGEIAVLDTHERAGDVFHYVKTPIAAGTAVTGRLDWDYRFANMQHHTGEHILSGIIHRLFGYDNVGFHMGQEAVTIDVNGLLSEEQLAQAELMTNQLIQQNVPVVVSYPDEESLRQLDYRSKKALTDQVRIITIENGDVCACCGTHVRQTGEIGLLKVLGAIHYKGGMRITMVCGLRALADYHQKLQSVVKISAALSVKQIEAAAGVEKLKQENAAKEMQIGRLYQKILKGLSDSYGEFRERLFLYEEELPGNQLRLFAEGLKGKGKLVLICSGTETEGYRYALGSQVQDVRDYSKEMNQVLKGRGGGSPGLVQGTLYAPLIRIREYFLGESENQDDE